MSISSASVPPRRHAWQALSGDAVPLLFVAACWLLMILLADPRGDFPLNDDWVYALAVKSVLETGSYQFPSPSSANVGPQIYWGALFCLPFGFSFTTLRLSTSVLGLGGAVVFYFLVRAVRGTRRTAVLCALALAANPVYFSLSNTFMTDVPFLAVSLVAMLLLFLGLRRDSLAHVTSGMLVALAAILIRQLGIVLIVGYVVAALVKEGWQVRRVARGVALVALGLAVHFGYQLWLVRTGRVPVATLHRPRMLRESRQIDSVVNELDPPGRRERGKVIAVRLGAGHEPRARRELLALFPFRDRPDVLGMRRAGPRQAPQHRCIARD